MVLPGYTLERASCGIFKAALYKFVSFLTDALWHLATNLQSPATSRVLSKQAFSTAEQHRDVFVKEAHTASSLQEAIDKCTSPAEICTHCLCSNYKALPTFSGCSCGCVRKHGVALHRI